MSINVDPPARDNRSLRERLYGQGPAKVPPPTIGPVTPTMPLPQRPLDHACAAINAALAHDDNGLTAILDALAPADLYTLAKAASRLRRACEQVHNGGQGEPPHHGRTRWDFSS